MAKYPNIKVQLLNQDGNIFRIISRVRQAMKQAGISGDDIEYFTIEVEESDSYDQALQVITSYVEVV